MLKVILQMDFVFMLLCSHSFINFTVLHIMIVFVERIHLPSASQVLSVGQTRAISAAPVLQAATPAQADKGPATYAQDAKV